MIFVYPSLTLYLNFKNNCELFFSKWKLFAKEKIIYSICSPSWLVMSLLYHEIQSLNYYIWSNLISTTKHYDHRNRIKCKVNFYSISLLTHCKDVSSRVSWISRSISSRISKNIYSLKFSIANTSEVVLFWFYAKN